MEKLREGIVTSERVAELFKHSIDGSGNCKRIFGSRIVRFPSHEMTFRSLLVQCECGGDLEVHGCSDTHKVFRCRKCQTEYSFRPNTWKVTKTKVCCSSLPMAYIGGGHFQCNHCGKIVSDKKHPQYIKDFHGTGVGE